MDLPELGTPSDVSKAIQQKAKTLVPWLPDPYICPNCSVYCDASRTYDPTRAAFYPMGMAPSWECPECGQQYVREGY